MLSVHDFWSKDGPRAYLSMMVPNFPNMFMLYGPNSQPALGRHRPADLVPVSGRRYIAKLIVRMIEEGKSPIEVKQRGLRALQRGARHRSGSQLLLLQEEGAPEKNYYVNEFGRLQMNAPWYGPEFHRMCTDVEWDDIEIT